MHGPEGTIAQRGPVEQHPSAVVKLHQAGPQVVPRAVDALGQRCPACALCPQTVLRRILPLAPLGAPAPPVAVDGARAGQCDVGGLVSINQGAVVVGRGAFPAHAHYRQVVRRIVRKLEPTTRFEVQFLVVAQVQRPVDQHHMTGGHHHPSAARRSGRIEGGQQGRSTVHGAIARQAVVERREGPRRDARCLDARQALGQGGPGGSGR